MIYYPMPVPMQQAYLKYTTKQFEISNKLSQEVISLPMHTHLIKEDQMYICESIKEFIYG